MFKWLSRTRASKRFARYTYDAIVAVSRRAKFYSDFGVPDTVEGRFELLILHIFLFLESEKRKTEPNLEHSQHLVDLFFADMDTTSRELGVGDMSVPKKMRAIAMIYSIRMGEYTQALVKDKGELAPLIKENIELLENHSGGALADYVSAALAHLEKVALPQGPDQGAGFIERFPYPVKSGG